MSKFVLILLFTMQSPGEAPVESRRIFTDPFETHAACDLTGEVELSKYGATIDGVPLIEAEADCVELEWPEL